MTSLLLIVSLLAVDEAALREAFDKEFTSKEAKHRAEAVTKLAGVKEEKSIECLVRGLKDAELEVRKASAEAIEKSIDGGGVAIKALGEILVDKKEDMGLRKACAKSLATARYKGEALPFFLKTISSIDRDEVQFHKFGGEVTGILEKYAGKSFGQGRETPERWAEWWQDNQEALKKEDEKLRDAWKKEQNKN
jgi:hypothetical protein